MRVGQKGRLCHRWWKRGERPPGKQDHRYQWTYLFGAVRPDTGDAFALVLPVANAATMQLFLDEFAATLEPDIHAVMVLDGAGWHGNATLDVPDAVTLVHLPPYSPQLNPAERVWLYLRERFLSLCLFETTEDIVDVCCKAWNAFASNPDQVRSLTFYPWSRQVSQ